MAASTDSIMTYKIFKALADSYGATPNLWMSANLCPGQGSLKYVRDRPPQNTVTSVDWFSIYILRKMNETSFTIYGKGEKQECTLEETAQMLDRLGLRYMFDERCDCTDSFAVCVSPP